METPSESPAQPPSRKSKKRRRLKIICWLSTDIIALVVIAILLFHTPSGYQPNLTVTNQGDRQLVPRYWSYLSSEIYNRAQLKQPFDLIIEQEPVNEAIAQAPWPQRSESAALYAPTATFMPGLAQFIGTAEVQGAEFHLTIEIKPTIDPNGMATLRIRAIRIGAMNITPVAKLMARKAYHEQIMMIDHDRIESKIVASLLDGKDFDPVFTVKNLGGRRATVRVNSINIEADRIVVGMEPIDHNR
ncbi:hypothetical protein ACFL6U_18465 [Planctomycetota bacterium]